MTNQKKQHVTGGWLVFAIIIGTGLGVALGGLVWWLTGAIVIGLFADLACSRRHAPDDKSDHEDVA